MTGVEQGRRSGRRGALVAPCYVFTLLLPFINSEFMNLFNKNDLHETQVNIYQGLKELVQPQDKHN